MSRKHFQAMADAIRELAPEARKAAAEAMAKVCKSFNPRFDESRFLQACGV